MLQYVTLGSHATLLFAVNTCARYASVPWSPAGHGHGISPFRQKVVHVHRSRGTLPTMLRIRGAALQVPLVTPMSTWASITYLERGVTEIAIA